MSINSSDAIYLDTGLYCSVAIGHLKGIINLYLGVSGVLRCVDYIALENSVVFSMVSRTFRASSLLSISHVNMLRVRTFSLLRLSSALPPMRPPALPFLLVILGD